MAAAAAFAAFSLTSACQYSTALVVGSYRDNVIVENRAGTGTLTVPVVFRIYP